MEENKVFEAVATEAKPVENAAEPKENKNEPQKKLTNK